MEKIANIFYSGIKYVNYGKANCAREMMRYKAVEQHLAEKLLKRRDVADRLRIKVNSFRGKESEKWTHLEIPSDDDTLEQIYEFIMGSQLIGKKGEKRKEDAIQAVGYDGYIYEMETVERNREVIDHDLGKKLLHIFRYLDEYEQPASEWESNNILSEKNKLFLEQFEKEFTSYTRIDSVFFGTKHNKTVTDMPEQIFKIFGINARKMHLVSLSEQEVNALTGLAATWNQKKYVLAMQT